MVCGVRPLIKLDAKKQIASIGQSIVFRIFLVGEESLIVGTDVMPVHREREEVGARVTVSCL